MKIDSIEVRLRKSQGKFIIGLTGNIGTGKTVVRRMLEQLGAYTIDADSLSHRAIAKGGPGYESVVLTFGKWILDADGQIDRSKLRDLVFRDATALARLEEIIHPLVRQASELLIQRARQPVIVVEAIKLLEGELRQLCDSIWVTYAPPAIQVERLTRKREINREEALRMVKAQGAQSEKIEAANVVISNTGTYDDLWKQVAAAWGTNIPGRATGESAVAVARKAGRFSVIRGKPNDAEVIAQLINRLSKDGRGLTAEEVIDQDSEKTYLLLQLDGLLVGAAAWNAKNLVVRTTDLCLNPGIDIEKGLETLVREIEMASEDLQCEISLMFPTTELIAGSAAWTKLGYERGTVEALGVQSWMDVALETATSDPALLLFKPLQQDRMQRPI